MIDDPLKDTDLPADDTVELDNVDRIMIILHSRFKEQGSTGYNAYLEHNGCVCAIGALKLDQGLDIETPMIWSQITQRYGFPVSTPVWRAHDQAVNAAMEQGLPGIDADDVTLGDGSPAARALFDTPAYDFVMSELERRLRDARR